jgi:hypothetical protein
MSLAQEYADALSALCGNEFQAEVCARLQSVILGFQTVPAKPQGDAGLDGFSHEGRRAYCCYGPEHDEFKTKKDRETAIVNKFRADLRRLFELVFNENKLIHKESPEMATILPSTQKIEHIELIVNWFESHRVLNPLSTAVSNYKSVSACRYVDSSASVIVVGPKDLANRYAVDEMTIARSRQRVFVDSVKEAAGAVTIQDPKDFDSKMFILRQIRPDQLDAIKALSEKFLANWRMAIAFESKLDATMPPLHQILEEDRARILTRVAELMIASDQPWTQLGKAGTIAQEILARSFERQFGGLIVDVSSGEIARLIGECPIGWKAPEVSLGQ